MTSASTSKSPPPVPCVIKAPRPTTLRLVVSDDEPLGNAKAALIRSMAKRGGAYCPLCSQQSTIYQRNVNGSIVRVLCGLARWRAAHGNGFANLPNVIFKDPTYGVAGTKVGQGGQWAQATFWDLVERERGVIRPDGSNRTGYARLTSKGVAFLAGTYRIRKYALVYDNVLLGKAGELVSVHDVQDVPFDFADIFTGKNEAPTHVQDEPLFVNKDHFLDVSILVFGEGECAER